MRFKKLSVLFLLFFMGVQAYAGTTGKISGTVRDVKTGDLLPGVNVRIVGTTRGAATDKNGFYFIINIPPGKYTLQASMIGYASVSHVGVQVMTDITTQVNFNLAQSILQGQAVTVVARRDRKSVV